MSPMLPVDASAILLGTVGFFSSDRFLPSVPQRTIPDYSQSIASTDGFDRSLRSGKRRPATV